MHDAALYVHVCAANIPKRKASIPALASPLLQLPRHCTRPPYQAMAATPRMPAHYLGLLHVNAAMNAGFEFRTLLATHPTHPSANSL